ncbi:hypothetical protein KKD62_03265 [Patescibacteria group bacterium]|nr:hypothetical protein [Patescibacteria group bacterium]MBU1931518.1 hypothetical protein [Patescibacteria group bacterium]
MQRLVLIDAHALLHRAYHAFPKTLVNSKGEMVNAVYGFARTLLSLFSELKPSHVVVAFDQKGPTFRHHQFKGYKATRPKVDQELIDQIKPAHEVVEVLNIPIREVAGFEADDVIGTIVRRFKTSVSHSVGDIDRLDEIIIVTGDKDAFQLVNDRVKVYMPSRGQRIPAKLWDQQAVVAKLGIKPEQVVDFKALAGDASDDIPGVKGIGQKMAQKLLNRWQDLETIYSRLNEVQSRLGSRVVNLLKSSEDTARLSQKLAQIFAQVPIKVNLRQCQLHDYDKVKAVKKFTELEFKSLIKKLPNDSLEEMTQEVFGKTAKAGKKTNPVPCEERGKQMGLF